MLESEFQSKILIPELKETFPGSLILKNDEQYLSGVPDLILLHEHRWAFIEVKRSIFAVWRPNQEWYLDEAERMGAIGVMICPENKMEMIQFIKNTWGVH